jgi:APA family basic amino acid/polyamine antiporter
MAEAKDKLKREIGLFSATALVIATMIGTGIFMTPGFIIQELGNPYVMLFCWLVGGLFALCGALCYGELGAIFPKAGGEYVFLRESFGKCMGFLSGWISLIVGFSAPIAAGAVAFAAYVFNALSFSNDFVITLSLWGNSIIIISYPNILASVVIIILSLLHYYSLNIGVLVQNALTVFKIALILVFIAAGLWAGSGSVEHFSESLTVTSLFKGDFAVSLIFVSYTYFGWNAAAYLGSEIKNPTKNIPLALIAGTFLVICLYLLLNIVYIYALTSDEMSGVIEVGTKAAVALFGANIAIYFTLAIAIGILSALSGLIMVGPRIYYAMSKDRIFFQLFSRIDKVHQTPAYSIFLQAGIAVFLVMTSSFDKLLIYIGFTLSIFTTLTVIGMLIIRRKQSGLSDGCIKTYRTFGYPVTPLFFILGNLWIIFYSIKCRPISSLYGLLTIASGISAFFYFNKRVQKQLHRVAPGVCNSRNTHAKSCSR